VIGASHFIVERMVAKSGRHILQIAGKQLMGREIFYVDFCHRFPATPENVGSLRDILKWELRRLSNQTPALRKSSEAIAEKFLASGN
jgi:hypothetical protein